MLFRASLCLALAALFCAGEPSSAAAAENQSLTRLLQREASVLTVLERLTHGVVQAGRELDDLRYQDKQLRYQIEESSRKISAMEKRIAQRRHHLRIWSRSLYKLSRGSFIRVLLDQTDGQQVTQRLAAARLILGRDRHELKLYKREIATLQRQQQALITKRRQLDRLKGQLEEKHDELKSSRRWRLQLLLNLKRDRGLQEALSQELDQQQRTLLRRIAVLSDRAYDAWGFAGLKGKLPRPVSGPVVGVFGRAASQELGVEILRHGVTLRPAERTAVRTVASGVVRMAGPIKGYGNLVLVEHADGYFSLYGFLAKVLVHEGDRLRYRNVVGHAGLDPLTAKPALYFELRFKDRPLDPAIWLRR